VSLLTLSEAQRSLKRGKKKGGKKQNGVCVVGCTPYVNPENEGAGILKWLKLVEEMAENCDIMVHVGDTKAGAAVCNKNLMVSLYLI